MSRFIPTKYNNPCPICGDIKGKCRTTDDNDLILCMAGAGGLIDAVNGHKYHKDTEDGSWGIFSPDNQQGTFNREEWLRQKASAEKLKQETHRKEALLERDRHKHYVKISQHLGLSSEHQQELIRRGLTQSQIDKLNSFTVEGVTYLPDSTPPNLPSVRVSQKGEKYFSAFNPPTDDNQQPTPSRAYFCPAFNFEGEIIGGQFRHNRQDNKYTWLSGIKSAHLPDGEIPLTIVRAENVTDVKFNLDTSKFGEGIKKAIAVLEGLFKPYISTCKWGIDSIGASGFNFRNSHNQVREYVKKGDYNLAIFPLDANLINNPQLLRRLAENIYLFQSCGCQIAIAWWGQSSKSDLDFDELENLDNVQLLTIDEFISLTGVNLEGQRLEYNEQWVDDIDEIDPIHGKVIASGAEALALAKFPITEDDLREHTLMSLEEFKIALDNKEFSEFEEKFIRQLNQLSKRREKGFGTEFIRIPKFENENINYHPDSFYLTIKEDFSSDKTLIIPHKYRQDQHKIKILNHLRKIGVKNVFLNWQTGEGKSHIVSKLNCIIYLDTNYKNPSIPELKNAPYLTPRTYYGLYSVNGQIVVDPDEKIREKAEDNNYPEIYKLADSNCILKPAFRTLQNKGYRAEENNLPCQKCLFKKNCTFVEGKFKRETRNDISEIIAYGQGRMHPSQLTSQKLEKLSDFSLVWEEVGNLPTTNDYYFCESDLKDLHFQLSQASPEIIEPHKKDKLLNTISRLIYLLNPDTAKEITEYQGKYYGLTHDNFQEIFTSTSIGVDFDNAEYLSLITFLIPNINDLMPNTNYQTEKLSYGDRQWQSAKHGAERYMREQLRLELFKKLEQIGTNPLFLLDAILDINQDYILSTQKIETKNSHYWTLAVTTPNNHYSEMAKQAKFNLFLDATITETQIKAIFNLENEPLITVSTEKSLLDNLNIFKINIEGLGSNDWSNSALERVKTGIELIKSENPRLKIAVICPKKYAHQLNTDFWYGKHDRGTNELMDYDAIIFCGTPFINVGAVQREYQILFNHKEDKPTFEQFYHQKIYELRMQGLGRSRSQHFKNKQLHQFYLTTNEDLSYLKETGCNYQEIDGEILSPELGKKGDRTTFKIQVTVFNLIKAGIKVTCQAVANGLGITKQAVSKAVKGMGLSWKEFINCQLSLYETYKGEVDKFENNPNWFVNFFHENQTECLLQFIKGIQQEDSKSFFTQLKNLEVPYSIVSKILWYLSGLFDERLPELLVNKIET